MKWQILMVLAASLMIAADAPKKDDAKKDKDQSKLEGTWTLTNVEPAPPGQKLDADQLKGTKIMFKGDQVTLTAQGKDQPATFKADASKKPAEIDITPTDGPEKGKTMKGLYSVSGDTLKVAFARGEDKRPTDLAAKSDPNNLVIVMTFTREKR